MSRRELDLWVRAVGFVLDQPGKLDCPSTKNRWCPCDMVEWYNDIGSMRYALYGRVISF